jgi:hypothetical protein
LVWIFDFDTSGSSESLSFMQKLDIFRSIIWFVFIFTQLYFIVLRN